MSKFILTTFLLLFFGSLKAQFTISGYVTDKNSQEPLVGVTVGIKSTKSYTLTNNYGFYTLNFSKFTDSVKITYSIVGYATNETQLKVSSNKIDLNIGLDETSFELNSVIVKGDNPTNVERILGGITFNPKQIKAIPALLGEKDIIKAIQFLPGVQRGIEGSAAIFVRGGNGDQNLLVLDDAVVYNANHFFGFFSVFNPDIVKNVSFFNGGIPARYGGRLSSVIDIQMKEGNKNDFHAEGGIGIISSRLTLEGPIKFLRRNASFIISGRRTYFDPLLKLLDSGNSEKLLYKFYDVNAKFNIELNAKNKLYFSTYTGYDELSTQEKRANSTVVSDFSSSTNWGNKTATLRWNHLFNQKLFLNNTFTYTNYQTTNASKGFRQTKTDTLNQSQGISSLIRDFSLKSDFEYYKTNKSQLKFGFQTTFHTVTPRKLDVFVNTKNIATINTYKNIEAGIYLENVYRIGERLLLNSGFRLNSFFVKDKIFILPEPRALLSYETKAKVLLKTTYARMNQNISLLSNNGLGLSIDTWIPATKRFVPQQTDIVSLEAEKMFKKSDILFTTGLYFKKFNNILSYREGVKVTSFDAELKDFLWEDNVTQGEGISVGSEWGIRKTSGKLTGIASYTLSKTIHRFQELNQGKPFYPRQDIRNSFNIVGSYDITQRIKVAASWVYTSGSPINIPQGSFLGLFSDADEVNKPANFKLPYYGARNSFRTAAYHRLDFSIQFIKKKKRMERTWEIGVFNAYNRANPFYYYVASVSGVLGSGITTEVRNLSLLPLIPSLNYSFKF